MRRRESIVPPRAHGLVEERPWGVQLAAFARAGTSGQLSVHAEDGKVYTLALAHGLVVGATSPAAADRVARVAVGDRLITPARIGELSRRSPSVRRDEVDAFVAAAGLSSEQALRLERRVLVQRAARTFAVERGTWAIEERISIPVLLGVSVDLGAVIYQGARLNLEGERLAADMRGFGTRFELAGEHVEGQLARFELGDAAAPIVEALRTGTSLAELEALHRDLDPRMVQAALYALAACGAIAPAAEELAPPRPAPTADLSLPRTPTPRAPTLSCVPMLIRSDPVITRSPTPREPDVSRVPTPREPDVSRVPTPREPDVSRVPTPREPTFTRVPAPHEPTVTPRSAWREPTVTPRSARREPTVTPMPAPPRQRPSGSRVPPPPPPASVRPPVPPPPSARGTAQRRPEVAPRAETVRPPRFPTLPVFEARATAVRPNALSVREVRALIAGRSALLEQGADHFTLLGLPIGAPVEAVRAAYLELARNLQPDRLAQLGIRDPGFQARALLAQACIAHTVLTDPSLRAAYVARLRDLRVPAAAAIDFAHVAAEAFARGEQALRADDPELAVVELRTACELVPDEIEYLATLGRAELGVRAARDRRGDAR